MGGGGWVTWEGVSWKIMEGKYQVLEWTGQEKGTEGQKIEYTYETVDDEVLEIATGGFQKPGKQEAPRAQWGWLYEMCSCSKGEIEIAETTSSRPQFRHGPLVPRLQNPQSNHQEPQFQCKALGSLYSSRNLGYTTFKCIKGEKTTQRALALYQRVNKCQSLFQSPYHFKNSSFF